MFLKYRFIYLLSLLAILIACDNTKVIEADNNDEPSAVETIMGSEHNHETNTGTASNERHNVRVKEVLQADRYTYLKVMENNSDFWIAIPKSEVEVGQEFYYEGGLMKRNFKSVEFDRVFETIYLVSRIQPIRNKQTDSGLDEAFAKMNGSEMPPNEVQPMELAEGVIALDKLMGNPNKYEGRVIQVQGQVVKFNSQIMGRNWVHIQDGSRNDGEMNDLTITTMEQVLMGAKVIFEGKIALNQDFGAGYRYDILMEGAVLR